MNDNNLTDLTSNMTDFFAPDPGEKSGGVLGGAAEILLHLIVLAAAIYSGYHGINATSTYRAAQGLGNAAGIIGILIIEATLIGIYVAYFYRRITGDGQKWIAGVTLGIGLVFATLGVVGDSQSQAGIDLSSWLATYLIWFLPFAPIVMAVGASLTLASSPTVIRRIKAARKQEDAAERRHDARMKAEDAKLTIATNTANVQLNALQMVGQYALQAYQTPEVQAYAQRAALASLPDIMRGAGIFIPYGTIIDGQIVAPLSPTESAAESPSTADQPAADRPGLVQRLRNRIAGQPAAEQDPSSQPASPPAASSSDDAPRHELADLTPAELRQLMADLAALREARAAAPSGAGGNNGIHPNA